MSCCQSCIASKQFDRRVAERELRRYRRRGPDASTLAVINAVQARALPPSATLMDVGGGIGAIHHVLLDRGFGQATHFDASDAYLTVAAAEADRLGHTSRVRFEAGDFSSATSLPTVDVVTLHRVVCCDRNGPELLRIAAAHARRLVAFSFPRPRWITRVVLAGINALKRLTGDPFRVYLHEPSTMAASLEREGMRRTWSGGTFVWAVEIFERAA